MYKLFKVFNKAPSIQRKNLNQFVAACEKFFYKRYDVSESFSDSFFGGAYYIQGDNLHYEDPLTFFSAVCWIGRLLDIDGFNPFNIGLGPTHWIDDYYNPRYEEYEQERIVFETLLRDVFKKSVFDYEICKHFHDPDAPFKFYGKPKKLDEHCSFCGDLVTFKSGKFVNRVIDANDVETRKSLGRKYPAGDFVCAECDNGE